MPIFLARYASAIFILPVVLGLVLPSVGSWFYPHSILLLFTVMTLSLLEVPVLESLRSGLNAQGLKVLTIQYGIFAALCFIISRFFPPELFIGFIIVASTPSGISVPSIVDLYGGNTSRSISITVLNNVLAPILTPLLVLLLAGQRIQVDAVSLFYNLVLFIFLPMVVAGALKRTPFIGILSGHRKPVNVLLLLVLGWGLTSKSASFFYQNPWVALAAALVLLVVALLLFFVGTHLAKNRADRIAYATLCYHRNYTLSITLLSTLFSASAAAIGVVYLIVVHAMIAFTGYFFGRGARLR